MSSKGDVMNLSFNLIRSCSAGLMVAASVLCAPMALGQTFPTKPVFIINPYPAGGGADLMVRILAEELSKGWKQPVIVDSKAGAGCTLAAGYVARAPADGHVLLLSTTAHATALFLYKNGSYNYL